MLIKKIRCPKCNEIFTITGDSGVNIKVNCPVCGLAGKFAFPAINAKQDNFAITVQNLKKIYGDLAAVDDISFEVKKGEVFAFLGPNGAGKTTTVEMIESIRQPTKGTITILGRDIKNSFNEVKSKIGILPQEFHSFERLTVRETLDYFSKLYDRRADIDDIILTMDLKDKSNTLYKDLSGGQKQRVGVAISLVNDPEIIFLDEPTTGLDPKARREVWEVIAGLRKRGKTVFLTTHYMEEAEYLADHIAIIHKGKIIAEGSLEDLINKHGKGSLLHIRGCNSYEIIDTLKGRGFETYSQGNGNISVKIEFKERVLDILSILRHECVEYSSIDIRRSNLEEIFLALTGARLSEAT
ncbi:MAG: ATP-binding cassette domain-containing protein [Candidatus Thermoplasmatota archaeon]|nr:ATP-binding cassette domain-containing protein [Candidatus Thermoplasmatota archaeon]